MDLVERFARGWRLIKASTAVLNADGEMLLLPILSGAITVILGGALVWQAFDAGTFDALNKGNSLAGLPAFYVWLFGFYVVEYFVIIFFNTALVGAALQRLDGGDPTIHSALGLALRRVLPILGYAIISATVGMILRALGERGGIIGRLVAAGADIAWTVATLLVVPVLAAEGVGPGEAITRSGELVRKTWGENLIGGSGISLVTGLVTTLAALAGYGGWMLYAAGNMAGVPVIGVAAFVGVGAVAYGTALSAIYTAALYYFAALGEPPVGFDGNLVRGAFASRDTAEI